MDTIYNEYRAIWIPTVHEMIHTIHERFNSEIPIQVIVKMVYNPHVLFKYMYESLVER